MALMTLPDCQKAHDVWPCANRLDDADARSDLADLRAGLVSLRKLRLGLIQKCLGWFVQAALMLMGLGILVILSHQQ
ncbi:hypothetical protein OAV74_00880 [Alphaproteobacteria bacterium]|nr:hypothetical protein [Alphaproteobacteria bacterium]